MSDTNKDDGGPVHPVVHTYQQWDDSTVISETISPGASLRDYFAVHAPEVPNWFEPAMPTKRPELSLPPKIDNETIREGKQKRADMTWEWSQAADKWDAEYRRQRSIQWPYAWADMQLAERAKRV